MKSFICALIGHNWQWLGPKSWAQRCMRCGDRWSM